jgi:hypothetical protein
VTQPTTIGRGGWRLRSVPQHLADRYRAEGWWADATVGQMVADGLGSMGHVEFRVRSQVRPWNGTFADVDQAARSLATELRARGVGPGSLVVSPDELAVWRKRPPKAHPLVWQHKSGRKSLVLGATTDHVIGMGAHEGRALLDELLARSTTRDRVYRHEWSVGDVVIWDNRGVLHRACPYDPTSLRDMHRTTFAGDEPIQ